MTAMWSRRFFVSAVGAAAGRALGQSKLPAPEEADLPYIVQVGSLIPTDRAQATEEDDGKFFRAWLEGTAASAKTPLAGPEFLFRSESIAPSALRLYRFEVVKGRREVVLRKKKKVLARPYLISAYAEGDNVFRIRTDESLPRGEYGMSPDGSNVVFCFAVI